MMRFRSSQQSWRRACLYPALWSVGILIVLPAFMVIFPCIIGMGWAKYGMTPMGFLDYAAPGLILLWLAGLCLGGILHLANQFISGRSGQLQPENDHPEKDPRRLSVVQILATTTGIIIYGYLAIVCTVVLISAAIWLGVITGIFFILFGGLAFRQHLASMRRS